MGEFFRNIALYSEKSPMIFTTYTFWIFFLVLLAGFCLVYKNNRIKNIYLFGFSLFFYYKSGGYFTSLLLFSIVLDYSFGLLIFKYRESRKKILFLIASIVVNLGVLAYFKYTYFLIDTINNIFGTHIQVKNILAALSNQTIGTSFGVEQIILPVGISFYTFQSMSYIIDVYRGRLHAVKNIIDYGFFVTFFPQLVAGPIVRANEFIPQLTQRFQISQQQFGHALFLILSGLAKKMIVSDYISVNFVDRIFSNPGMYTGFENLMSVYGYGIQIYCDFSGYTDIAIGIGMLLGFTLPINFNSPYKATSITDFWRRWHISLSTWLKDYLYISLGGNRHGKLRTNLNLMITMLLGGLWHGAHLKFLIWGGLHGLGLVVHKLWQKANIFKSIDTPYSKYGPYFRFASIFITLHFVMLTWVFFRAGSMENIQIMFDRIFTDFEFALVPQIVTAYAPVFMILIFAYIIHWLPAQFKENVRGRFIAIPFWYKPIIVLIVIFFIYQMRTADLQPFIYFQF